MEHINLIRKIAWSFHQTTGLDWDDLFQEGYLAYMESLESYDPTRGKITTHCWNVVTSRLTNYLKKEKQWNDPLVNIDDINPTRLPTLSTSLFWESLTSEAREVASIVLRTPKKFVTLNIDDVCDRVYRIMKLQGYTHYKITKGIDDLLNVCNTVK